MKGCDRGVYGTVFLMADESQPGRAVTGTGSVVLFKYAPANLFIDVYAECFVDLLSYPGSAKPREIAGSSWEGRVDKFALGNKTG